MNAAKTPSEQAASGPVLVRAARMLTMRPGAPTLHDGAALHDGQTILEVGEYARLARGFSGRVEDMGDVVLAPGLINAHAHLELSGMRGRIKPGLGFPAWVKAMISDPERLMRPEIVKQAATEAREAGVAFMADISTYNARAMGAILDEVLPGFIIFHEVIGHAEVSPDDPVFQDDPGDSGFGRGILAHAGHALYSTSGELLRAAKSHDRKRGLPFSIHLAEHDDEVAILNGRPSGFMDLLKKRGMVRDYDPPNMDPALWADRLGLLDEHTLCVHCAKLGARDIALLAERGVGVCLCPRSNEFIGTGRAPWEELARTSLRLCLGTDSLASNTDLDLWSEALHLAEHWDRGSGVPLDLERVIGMLTANPADILGISDRFGMIAPGRAPVFSAVPPELIEMLQA